MNQNPARGTPDLAGPDETGKHALNSFSERDPGCLPLQKSFKYRLKFFPAAADKPRGRVSKGIAQIGFMSAVTSTIGSSSAASFATQLAPASAWKRSLSNLGIAIQSGELAPASSILTAFFKANPQYTSTSSDESPSPDPLSQDFQALASAISSNQIGAAQTAWTQVKRDLGNNGAPNPGDGTTSTSEFPAQTKASMDGQIVSNVFNVSSDGGAAIDAFPGGSEISSSQTGLSSTGDGNRLSYQPSGTTAPDAITSKRGILLDTAV
jgi:hypothetical protein